MTESSCSSARALLLISAGLLAWPGLQAAWAQKVAVPDSPAATPAGRSASAATRVAVPRARPTPARAPANLDAPVKKSAAGATAAAAAAPAEGVDVQADRLEYETDAKLMIGAGNVIVKSGLDTLRADYVRVNTATEQVYAKGHVIFEREGRVWTGTELNYNFRSLKGDFGEFTAYVPPLYVTAADSEREDADTYRLTDARVTSCDGDDPELYGRAARARIYKQQYISAFNMVYYLRGVPFFYLPYYWFDTNRSGKWDFVPGYSSRWGAFLLSSYSYNVHPNVEGTTRLDYRTKRGVAVGQDFKWNNWREDYGLKGGLKGYYARDKDYEIGLRDDWLTNNLVSEQRYRLQLNHAQTITDNDYLIADINYLSDPDILKTFYPREYEDAVQPENRISLTHRGETYNAGLLINKRLNDFYENVDRIPEATLDFRRQRIGDSPFYYEGQNAATYLQRVYPDYDTQMKKYDAGRVDTRHMIYYPTKQFDFLTVIPRGGYRGTFYSKTLEETTTSVWEPVAVTNIINNTPVVSTTLVERAVSVTQEAGAKWRNLPELGGEISFKAFKVLDEPTTSGGGLRHIAEPYLDYTYRPHPNVMPYELYQFDEIDQLHQESTVRLGLRNKLQTKVGKRVRNLLDVDMYNDRMFMPYETDEHYGPFTALIKSELSDELSLRSDLNYNWYGESFYNFNARAEYREDFWGNYFFEYRYLKKQHDQVTFSFDLMPKEKWSPGAYWRYQFMDARMEEQTYYLTRRTRCLGITGGYTGRGDDWDVWFQIWLLAFPDSMARSEFNWASQN